MRDEFQDVMDANPQFRERLLSVVLDGRVGIFPQHPFHSGHQNVVDKMLQEQDPLILAMGNHNPPVVHHNPSNAMGTNNFGELSGRFVHLEIKYECDDFFDRLGYDIPLDDSDKNLPEWQRRRNASANAKQALIDKMKAKRNAR